MPLLLLLLWTQAPAAPPAVAHLTLSAPAAVAKLDAGKLHGEITQLAWSPDGTELYLQTTDTDRFGNVRHRHYVMTLDGKAPRGLDAAPDWAAKYWSWKSAPGAPGGTPDDFRIKVERDQQTFRTGAAPMGGSLATGGGDSSALGAGIGDILGAAHTRDTATVMRLRLANKVIGEWINANVQPGLTFGWAPASVGVMAYADKDHEDRLMILDPAGQTRAVEGTKDVVLPAWSEDGRQLAFLQRDGGKKYVLQIVKVTAD